MPPRPIAFLLAEPPAQLGVVRMARETALPDVTRLLRVAALFEQVAVEHVGLRQRILVLAEERRPERVADGLAEARLPVVVVEFEHAVVDAVDLHAECRPLRLIHLQPGDVGVGQIHVRARIVRVGLGIGLEQLHQLVHLAGGEDPPPRVGVVPEVAALAVQLGERGLQVDRRRFEGLVVAGVRRQPAGALQHVALHRRVNLLVAERRHRGALGARIGGDAAAREVQLQPLQRLVEPVHRGTELLGADPVRLGCGDLRRPQQQGDAGGTGKGQQDRDGDDGWGLHGLRGEAVTDRSASILPRRRRQREPAARGTADQLRHGQQVAGRICAMSPVRPLHYRPWVSTWHPRHPTSQSRSLATMVGPSKPASAGEAVALQIYRDEMKNNFRRTFTGATFLPRAEQVAGAAGDATDQVVEVVDTICGEIVQSKGYAAFKQGVTAVAQPGPFVWDVLKKVSGLDSSSEILTAIGPHTLTGLFAAIVPFYGVIGAGVEATKKFYKAVQDLRTSWQAQEALPAVQSGAPAAALGAVGTLLKRRS